MSSPDWLPRAASWRVFHCSNCDFAHIIFYDELDEPIMECVLSDINVERMYAQSLEALRKEGSCLQ